MDRAMTRIVIFGDIHAQQERLGTTLGLLDAPRYDLALLAGDVGEDPPWFSPARETDRQGHDDSVRLTVNRVAERVGCPVLFVPGNHDLRDPVEDLEGRNIDGRVVEVAGLRIAGFGGAGPTPYGFPYEWTEKEANAILERLLGGEQSRVDIFLTHTPPANSALDLTYHGEHVGSPAVRKWIGLVRPHLVVCGHIHEALGLERVEGVPCLNAGAMGEPHAQELVWIVDWNGPGPARVQSSRPGRDGIAEGRSYQIASLE
jgi:Icc-related predicted phosphoesterase